jgi:hypothetical protein
LALERLASSYPGRSRSDASEKGADELRRKSSEDMGAAAP